MEKIILRLKANNDLSQIFIYISNDSLYSARKTINDILNQIEDLMLFPYMGRKVPEYNINNIRELIYKLYRIIYEVESNKILIRRIWHSSRLLSKQ